MCSPFSPQFLSGIMMLLVGLLSPSTFADAPRTPPAESAKVSEKKDAKPSVKPQETKPDQAKPKGPKPVEKPAEKAAEETAEKPADKSDAKAGETFHKVETGEFVVKSKLGGIVDSVRQTPIAPDLKRWQDLSVLEVVPHGTFVKKGDLLIDLDDENLKKKIEEMKAARPLQELELTTAIEELEKLEKTTPLSLTSARRAKQDAEEDLAYFEDVSRPMREKDAKNELKSAENYLSYATEELNQLKKMYEKDDLTEETEEIILQRAQNSVDEYTWMLEQTRERVRRLLATTIPREEERLKSALELQQINWRAGEKSMRDALEKAKLEVTAKKRANEEAILSLEEHEADLEALDLRAPHDGIVYYGMNQKGKWTTASLVERKLVPGGKLAMGEVVMTVADPSRLHLRVMAPEDKVGDLAPGQSAEVTLKSSPNVKWKAKVESVSPIPYADGTFDTVLSIARGNGDAKIFPGMNATAEVVVYEKNDAITIPAKAVKKEGDESSVTLKGGKTKAVTTGRTQGEKVEILKGLSAGDEIVVPEAAAKSAPEAAEKKDEGKSPAEGEKK